jgi:hypothetical protein
MDALQIGQRPAVIAAVSPAAWAGASTAAISTALADGHVLN